MVKMMKRKKIVMLIMKINFMEDIAHNRKYLKAIHLRMH